MSLTLSVGQTSLLSAGATLNSGVVPVLGDNQGKVTWATNNANVVLTPALDGQTCMLQGAAVGSSTVTASMKLISSTLTATLSVTVAGAGNTPDAITVTAGTPTGP